MSLQAIYDLAEIAYQHGIRHAVICPGSRSAPLVLAFVRHPHITSRIIPDERSAGYMALGMAQQLQKPVVLICTSGTAALNLGPAVAEAYFQYVPLVVITADRPPEWIGQQDGQAIFQQNIFARNVKKEFQLPVSRQHPDEIWHVNRTMNEAILLSCTGQKGPVHINAPFREPFYPEPAEEVIRYSPQVRIIREVTAAKHLNEEAKTALKHDLQRYRKILVMAGQLIRDEKLIHCLKALADDIPIAGDITSNLHGIEGLIRHADWIIGQSPPTWKEQLRPELLITLGNGILSKNVRRYLRQYPPAEHWHLQADGEVADVFQHLSRVIRTDPIEFFHLLASSPAVHSVSSRYVQLWKAAEHQTRSAIHRFFEKAALSELHITAALMQHIPDRTHLHLANSMSVRYANLYGLDNAKTGVTVYANRGTSGIDGCVSTAVGHCLINPGLHVLITGDLAFFYDRNAFWHNYALPNLRIVLLNNHGGIIFKMIDGPAKLPEADEWFVTRQNLQAKPLCTECGFEHIAVESTEAMAGALAALLAPGKTPKVLELQSSISENVYTFEKLKNFIQQAYATEISLGTH